MYSTEDPATDPGGIDGSFGPMTESAVRAYQGDRGVGVDGIVGDDTWWVPAGAAGATLASTGGPDDRVAQFTDDVPRAGPVCNCVRSNSAVPRFTVTG